MSRFVKVTLVLLAVSALAVAPSLVAGSDEGVRASLSVGKWRFESTEAIAVGYTIANEGPASARVLRWDTPVDGIEADILVVERDGEAVPYVGKLAKRGVPQAEDYLELAPGETMTFSFDPSTAYDMSAQGRYTIRFRDAARRPGRAAIDRLEDDAAAEEARGGTEVALYFAGRGDTGRPEELSPLAKPGSGTTTKFTRCTTAQQNTLLTAEANATSRSYKAWNYLLSGSDGNGLYKTWFDFSGDRFGWGTVTSHFDSIYAAFSAGKATYNCGCNQNYYAYVYPTKPYTIYVCKVFWSASADRYPDTQAGTLVHEMSHFNATAKTNDWAYGTTNAMNFAITDPSKATTNADNHEYFAEKQ